MKHRIRLLSRNPLALAVLSISVSAMAQDGGSRGVEEIVVTATKRQETVQEIPAAIAAVTGEALSDRGLASVQDLAKAIPNLNWGEHFGTTLITIRGVGSTVDSGITEPTVAMYVDGVFLPRSTMSTLRAVDLERVEVLRGPQGTLYGRNATGGAINFISKEPANEFEAGVNLSTGSRSAIGGSAYISGPINDIVSYRLSGGHEEQDGYVKVSPGHNRLGGADVDYVRGMLRIAPSDELTVDLSYRSERNKAPNAWQQLFNRTVLPTDGQTTDTNRIIADQPYRQFVETTISSGLVNWDINDALTLRSITSYVGHESSVDVDADTTDMDGFNTVDFSRPSRSYSQEFTLSGDADDLNWIVGAFYFHEEAEVELPLRLGSVFSPAAPGSKLIQSVDSETSSYAIFTDLTYSITDELRVVAGLRYNNENQDFEQNSIVTVPGFGTIPNPGFAGGPVKVDNETDDILPKIALQYDVATDVTAYVQWSKGVKSGGLNLESGTGDSLGDLGLYDPEKISAYEIGLKSQLLDNTLTANFAAFYYDYSDLQVTITVPPTTTLVQNADAQIYGLEGELTWDATDQLRLTLAGTYTDATFDDFSGFDDSDPAKGVQDLDGEPLPHAPEFTANAGAEYRIETGMDWLSQLTLRADVSYSDDVTLRYFPRDEDIQKSYVLGNISARLSDIDDTNTLRLFVNNIGDVDYKQNVSYIGAVGAFMGNYAPPRTWGAQISHKF